MFTAQLAVPYKEPVNPPVAIADPVICTPLSSTLNLRVHPRPLNDTTLNPLAPPFLVSYTYSAYYSASSTEVPFTVLTTRFLETAIRT